ncbi:MAG: glucan 1,4-alpha-glucosidase [Thermodesulfobacteriota bacterium]|nr:MAG: glucan 1,4-alpha-glucosidase [Thermodesulfobacteriota bacterium]
MSVAHKPSFPFTSAEAFGKPGHEPRWTRASKEGAGTAKSPFSRVWFTMEGGIITEVYFPDIETACIKDLRFLVTDSRTFFGEEGKDTLTTRFEYIHEKAPGYVITNTARSGLWSITKRVVTDPQANSLVMNVGFKALHGTTADFRLFVLVAPHMKNMGYGNTGRCAAYGKRNYLLARREDTAAALASDKPFLGMSAGYSGISDGWHDLKDDLDMDWMFERAEDGNVALTAELKPGSDMVLALGFGKDEVEAALEAEISLSREYASVERDFIRGWRRHINTLMPLGKRAADGGRRFRASALALKAHEDKTFPGAVASSLSIPWGQSRGDEAGRGYRLVRPGDLCRTAFAFMAMGDGRTALSVLDYLQSTQADAGAWPLEMHVNGTVSRPEVRLENAALPILLAWRLRGIGLAGTGFYPMIKNAASYMARNGPFGPEGGGASPSTLAYGISALVAAAHWAREMRETRESDYLFSVADGWHTKIEEWTFIKCGCTGEGAPGHYMRMDGGRPFALAPEEEDFHALVFNKDRPDRFPEHGRGVFDTGFLDLVRLGVRGPRDPSIVSSLRAVDRHLRFEHHGRVYFYRHEGDGYGEKEDGSPFDGSGTGRPWPLLSGERAMYEIAADGFPEKYLESLEASANEGFLFPEQVWDKSDIPELKLLKGRGTGSATPFIPAHAEYIKLLRSMHDRQCFDMIKEARERYVECLTSFSVAEWKKGMEIGSAKSSEAVRITSPREAHIVWTTDHWATRNEEPLKGTGLGIWHRDFEAGKLKPGARLVFTFRYADTGEWEGRDFEIGID